MPSNPEFEYKFNLLYTFYSLPNIILPFFGGNLVDRFTAPICLVVFIFFTFLGQFFFAIGVSIKSWNWMLLGRLVYGLGGENMCVAQSALLAVWFQGKELALSFGICLAISRLGSVLNNLISPVVANSTTVSMSSILGVGVNTLSLIMSIILLFMDYAGTKKCKRVNDATSRLTASLLEDRDSVEEDDDYYPSESVLVETKKKEKESISLRDIRKFGKLFWLLTFSCMVVYGCVIPFNNVASGILLERNYFVESNNDCSLTYPNQCSSGYLQNKTNSALKPNGNTCPAEPNTIPTIPTSINITNDNQIGWERSSYIFEDLKPGNIDCNDPFWSDACTKDYCDALTSATEVAGRVMSIPYIISAALSPPLGHIVDKIGRRAIVASLAPIMLFIVHMTLAFSSSSPVFPLVGQGIAYSLFAAVIWPAVPLTVDEHLTGTAFGVITAGQNMGLSLFPLIVASLYKLSGDNYIPLVEVFFALCAFTGVLIGIYLNVVDARTGGKLNYYTEIDGPHSEGGDEQENGYISTLVPAADSDYI